MIGSIPTTRTSKAITAIYIRWDLNAIGSSPITGNNPGVAQLVERKNKKVALTDFGTQSIK